MKVLHTFRDVRKVARGPIGLVPTMGYLHEGHLALIDEAAGQCETVIVSVFVNPLQFNDTTDLDTYPDDLERDVELAVRHGADVVFAPDLTEMYPTRQRTTVTVAEVADAMEGEHRRDHFVGVATVVAKLFSGVRPDVAYFGRKDAQQLAVVTTMAAELSMPVHVVGLPTVRESDGLALSSRNTRLTRSERRDALMLSQGLFGAAHIFSEGEHRSAPLEAAVRDVVVGSADIQLEYVTVADASTATPVDAVTGSVFLALAARVGSVRLIDNVFIDGTTGTVDTGVKLDGPSILYGGDDPCC
ncbi:MAG: pantoate--beta-alanine ligase [Actinomycetia bacterium]|nr:pantoate--beta-alanine ligase [Actinomycetes bacterium]